MRIVYVVALLTNVCFAAHAQHQPGPPTIKPLAPEDCLKISKVQGAEAFRVQGEIQIGSVVIINSTIGRGGLDVGGIDIYDVVDRSCFRVRGT